MTPGKTPGKALTAVHSRRPAISRLLSSWHARFAELSDDDLSAVHAHQTPAPSAALGPLRGRRHYGLAITSRQLSLLVAVGMRPGASQSDVAHTIGLDLNTCSDLVARTVGKGLLRRERSASDARSYCLYLTDEGAAARDAGVALAPVYQDMVATRLSASERAQLIKLLRKMLGFG